MFTPELLPVRVLRLVRGKGRQVRRRRLPAGYVTTKPGTRGADFFSTGYASAAVIKEDESLKQTVSAGPRCAPFARSCARRRTRITVMSSSVSEQSGHVCPVKT